MKKIKSLILTGYALALLTGCNNDNSFKSIEIETYPKTTFYCGEEFSNTGITLKVNFNDGTSVSTENFTTSKPSTSMPGTQTVKVYYTDDEKGIDAYTTYEINIIDWTKEEKAFFAETTISSFAGVYYPKINGMKVVAETDDETGDVVDYWIEKENSSLEEIEEYCEMLKNYNATKKMSYSNGTYDVYFKFYEQPSVPSDYRDNYDEHDLVCYKYCASYSYLDYTTFTEYELYALEAEDTVVVGLNNDGDMIVRFIANRIYLENLMSCDVNEHLDLTGLFNGTAIEFLKQSLLGYTNEETGEYSAGYFDEHGPYAKEYMIFPDFEPDVISVADYCALYPWLHGEDYLAFEMQVSSDDEEGYEQFVSKIESITDFVKTTRTDKINRKDVNVNIYTIENKDYVGDLTIEVTDYMEDSMSYTETNGTIKTTVTVGSFNIYYRWTAPEIISPMLNEYYRIMDEEYGEDKYAKDGYKLYLEGTIIGSLTYYSNIDNVDNKESALNKFVADHLTGYTIVGEAGISPENELIYTAKYTNGTFDILIESYFAGNGKYKVDFAISTAKTK